MLPRYLAGDSQAGRIATSFDRSPIINLISGIETQQSLDPTPTFVQPGLTLGYLLPEGMLPSWVGRNARLSFSGIYTGALGRDRESLFIASTDQIGVLTVDGRVGFGMMAGTDFQLEQNAKLVRNGFELALRLAADHRRGPRFTLTPSVALFGGWSRSRYKQTSNFVILQFPFAGLPYELREKITHSFGGLELGLAGTWRLWGRSTFSIAGRAGVVVSGASLAANDCFLADPVVLDTGCPASPNSFVLNDHFNTNTSESGTAVGFRGGLTLALNVDTGYAIVSLGGMFTYWSAAPYVDNPRILDIPNSISTPAQLRFGAAWSAGGFVVVRIPLAGGLPYRN